MSKHMAVLDENNKVVNIILCNDDEPETPQLITYYPDNPAMIDGEYFEGAFYPVRQYLSWTRNTEKKRWDPPIPFPTDDKSYNWDEDSKSWIEVK